MQTVNPAQADCEIGGRAGIRSKPNGTSATPDRRNGHCSTSSRRAAGIPASAKPIYEEACPMNRNTISTGLRHQAEVAIWVRRRLADSRAGQFNTGRSMIDQSGVVLADGVGLGKTWEALAASALILVESGKKRRDGSLRQNLRKQPARVLVLCPPGLVSKWTREIRDPEGFQAHLERWAKASPRRAFVLDTLTEPYEIRRRGDLAFLDAGRIRRFQVELPVGTYVCNWNVLRKKIGSGRSRLAALRAQQWDILIVDEA